MFSSFRLSFSIVQNYHFIIKILTIVLQNRFGQRQHFAQSYKSNITKNTILKKEKHICFQKYIYFLNTTLENCLQVQDGYRDARLAY